MLEGHLIHGSEPEQIGISARLPCRDSISDVLPPFLPKIPAETLVKNATFFARVCQYQHHHFPSDLRAQRVSSSLFPPVKPVVQIGTTVLAVNP